MIDKYGIEPINVSWSVVRGDTASLRVDFLENDEITVWDTSDWSYVSSAYDKLGDTVDELTVESGAGYAIITAPSDITENWGEGYEYLLAELPFDLKVTSNDLVWTAVLGTIKVLGNVSEGL